MGKRFEEIKKGFMEANVGLQMILIWCAMVIALIVLTGTAIGVLTLLGFSPE
ncbi:hypothetical protein SEA_MADI_49 [Gordonia phage Madi]|uniref:Membrane protein n=1 Tax=Gordonia phage Sienna TaxID=2759396 RepID=A0A7L7SQE6_9CAUD|nr:membrane protein [Gordonia phage Sienna]QYW00852.1 hypothetical protein SEA_MADI_49 [Gordonia phage Madi]